MKKHYLVEVSGNYADEFNYYSIGVIDEETYLKLIEFETINRSNIYVEEYGESFCINIGTNDSKEYSDVEAFYKMIRVKEILESDVEVLSRLGIDTGYYSTLGGKAQSAVRDIIDFNEYCKEEIAKMKAEAEEEEEWE